ncbi:hypothetical protein FKM82_018576 [Ascaphus truei]
MGERGYERGGGKGDCARTLEPQADVRERERVRIRHRGQTQTPPPLSLRKTVKSASLRALRRWRVRAVSL